MSTRCANLKATSDTAFVTLLTSETYVHYASALGSSLYDHDPSVDRVCVTTMRHLHRAPTAWTVCHVTPLFAPVALRGRFADIHTKLSLFSLVQYRRILFLDADAIATRSLAPLLSRPMIHSCIAAADDIKYSTRTFAQNEFNSGVMLIRPNSSVFSQLISRLSQYRTKSRGGQHFLSLSFLNASDAPCQREQLSVSEHGNLAVFSWRPQSWPTQTPAIVHYTIYKPSRVQYCTGKYRQWCTLWMHYSNMSQLDGTFPSL